MRSARFFFGYLLTGLAALTGMPAAAQVVPDQTLGAESSVVIKDTAPGNNPTDLIEGGAIRGRNIFHSFSQFDILESEYVYFANPAGIDSILSRVTGGNPSNIFGTLGIAGDADLYLINPNGIVFGEAVSLDIEGSFYATTAGAIGIGDGVFSAIVPEQSQLLAIRPDASFFNYLTQASGAIANRGQLQVGGALSLTANNLDLSGQLTSGGPLTLVATDTLSLQERRNNPLVVFSGESLLVQGNEQINIEALAHPDSGLHSSGDMTLRSASPVLGDTAYWSGGNFRIETLTGEGGSLLSPADPIIRSLGDVDIEQYEGSSLHILAGGAVRLGSATITGPEPGAVGTGFLQETIQLSDGSAFEIDGGMQPTLDIRAGIAPNSIGLPTSLGAIAGLSPGATTSSNSSNGQISIENVSILAPNGRVLLTNQYQPNLALADSDIEITRPVNTSLATTGILANFARGSQVVIDARNDISLLDSTIRTLSSEQTLGDVTLLAQDTLQLNSPNGVATGIVTGVPLFDNNSGGTIRVAANRLEMAGNTSLITNTFGQPGPDGMPVNAGDIIIDVEEGGVSLRGGSQLRSDTTSRSNAGDIKITTAGPVTIDGILQNTGLVQPSGIGSTVLRNDTLGIVGFGDAGDITIEAASLAITNGAGIASETNGQGDAGNITIETTGATQISNGQVVNVLDNSGNRIPITRNSAVVSGVNVGAIGQGGDIQVNARSLTVEGGTALSTSTFGQLGSGNTPSHAGNITIEVAEGVALSDGSQLRSDTSGQGNAGNVAITAGGDVTFDGVDIINTVLTQTGIGSSVRRDDRIVTGLVGTGNAGNISIDANNVAITNGAIIESITAGIGNAGRVDITADNAVTLSGSRLFNRPDRNGNPVSFRQISNIATSVLSTASGQGGPIVISANRLELEEGAQLLTGTAGQLNADGDSSHAGDIVVNVDDNVTLLGGAQLRSGTSGQGNAGDISITADGAVTVDGVELRERTLSASGIGSTVSAPDAITGQPARGNAGTIAVNAETFSLTNGAVISSSSDGVGNAGNVVIETTGAAFLGGSRLISGPNSNGTVVTRRRNPVISTAVGPTAQGRGGNISISGESLTLEESAELITTTSVANLPSNATNQSAETVSTDAGNITIDVRDTASVQNGAQILSSTAGRGNAGDITITAGGGVTLNGSPIITTPDQTGQLVPLLRLPNITSSVALGARGQGGDLKITAARLALDDGARLVAATAGQQLDNGMPSNGGDITLKIAGDVTLQNGSLIDSRTLGQGNAGNIVIDAEGHVLVEGARVLEREIAQSSIVSQVSNFPALGLLGEGRGGTVTINAQSLVVLDGAAISASTFGQGNSGEIVLDVDGTIEISGLSIFPLEGLNLNDVNLENLDLENNRLILSSAISNEVTPSSTGDAAFIQIEAGAIEITDFGSITTGTTGNGNAGRVDIEVDEHIHLGRRSVINSSVGPNGNGRAGNVDIAAKELTLLQGSQIGSAVLRASNGLSAGQGTGGISHWTLVMC